MTPRLPLALPAGAGGIARWPGELVPKSGDAP
jgi:hypothetical protein